MPNESWESAPLAEQSWESAPIVEKKSPIQSEGQKPTTPTPITSSVYAPQSPQPEKPLLKTGSPQITGSVLPIAKEGQIQAKTNFLKKFDISSNPSDNLQALKESEKEHNFFTGLEKGAKGYEEANEISNVLLTRPHEENLDFIENKYKDLVKNSSDRKIGTGEYIGELFGGQIRPIAKTMGAAALGSMFTPIGGVVAGVGVGAADAAKTNMGASFLQAYSEARGQGFNKEQSYEKALTVAKAGAVGGAFEGALGAFVPKGSGKVAKTLLGKVATKGLEVAKDLGLDVTGAVSSQFGQNVVAQNEGIDRDSTDGLAENAQGEAVFSAMVHALTGGARLVDAAKIAYDSKLSQAEQAKVIHDATIEAEKIIEAQKAEPSLSDTPNEPSAPTSPTESTIPITETTQPIGETPIQENEIQSPITPNTNETKNGELEIRPEIGQEVQGGQQEGQNGGQENNVQGETQVTDTIQEDVPTTQSMEEQLPESSAPNPVLEVPVTSNITTDIITEAAKNGANKVKVVFKPITKEDVADYPSMQGEIGKQKVSVFDVIEETSDIAGLVGHENVESVTFITNTLPSDNLSPKAKTVLQSSLERYNNSTPEEQAILLANVQSQLQRNSEGLDKIGMGLDEDMVSAANEFIKIVTNQPEVTQNEESTSQGTQETEATETGTTAATGENGQVASDNTPPDGVEPTPTEPTTPNGKISQAQITAQKYGLVTQELADYSPVSYQELNQGKGIQNGADMLVKQGEQAVENAIAQKSVAQFGGKHNMPDLVGAGIVLVGSLDNKIAEITDLNEKQELKERRNKLLANLSIMATEMGQATSLFAFLSKNSNMEETFPAMLREFQKQEINNELPQAEIDLVSSELLGAIQDVRDGEKDARIKQLENEIEALKNKKKGTSRKRGADLRAEAFEELAQLLGAARYAIGDKSPKITSITSKIGESLIQDGLATIENVVVKVKEYLKKEFGRDFNLDEKAVLDGVKNILNVDAKIQDKEQKIKAREVELATKAIKRTLETKKQVKKDLDTRVGAIMSNIRKVDVTGQEKIDAFKKKFEKEYGGGVSDADILELIGKSNEEISLQISNAKVENIINKERAKAAERKIKERQKEIDQVAKTTASEELKRLQNEQSEAQKALDKINKERANVLKKANLQLQGLDVFEKITKAEPETLAKILDAAEKADTYGLSEELKKAYVEAESKIKTRPDIIKRLQELGKKADAEKDPYKKAVIMQQGIDIMSEAVTPSGSNLIVTSAISQMLADVVSLSTNVFQMGKSAIPKSAAELRLLKNSWAESKAASMDVMNTNKSRDLKTTGEISANSLKRLATIKAVENIPYVGRALSGGIALMGAFNEAAIITISKYRQFDALKAVLRDRFPTKSTREIESLAKEKMDVFWDEKIKQAEEQAKREGFEKPKNITPFGALAVARWAGIDKAIPKKQLANNQKFVDYQKKVASIMNSNFLAAEERAQEILDVAVQLADEVQLNANRKFYDKNGNEFTYWVYSMAEFLNSLKKGASDLEEKQTNPALKVTTGSLNVLANQILLFANTIIRGTDRSFNYIPLISNYRMVRLGKRDNIGGQTMAGFGLEPQHMNLYEQGKYKEARERMLAGWTGFMAMTMANLLFPRPEKEEERKKTPFYVEFTGSAPDKKGAAKYNYLNEHGKNNIIVGKEGKEVHIPYGNSIAAMMINLASYTGKLMNEQKEVAEKKKKALEYVKNAFKGSKPYRGIDGKQYDQKEIQKIISQDLGFGSDMTNFDIITKVITELGMGVFNSSYSQQLYKISDDIQKLQNGDLSMEDIMKKSVMSPVGFAANALPFSSTFETVASFIDPEKLKRFKNSEWQTLAAITMPYVKGGMKIAGAQMKDMDIFGNPITYVKGQSTNQLSATFKDFHDSMEKMPKHQQDFYDIMYESNGFPKPIPSTMEYVVYGGQKDFDGKVHDKLEQVRVPDKVKHEIDIECAKLFNQKVKSFPKEQVDELKAMNKNGLGAIVKKSIGELYSGIKNQAVANVMKKYNLEEAK